MIWNKPILAGEISEIYLFQIISIMSLGFYRFCLIEKKTRRCRLTPELRSPCPTPPHPPPTPQEMSNAQDPATVAGAGTQVKLRGWSHQGEGDESSHLRRHQELRAFLHLLGESTWGLAQEGL